MLYDWFGWCNGYGYPYTDLHTINLDWILCTLKKILDELKALDERVKDLEERMDKAEADIIQIKEELVNINNEIAHIKIEINNMYKDIDKLKKQAVIMIENYADFQNHTDEYTDNCLCYCKGAFNYNDGGEGFFQIKKETDSNWIQYPNIKINTRPPQIGANSVAVRQMTNNLYPLLYFGIDDTHVPTQLQVQNMFEYFALYTKEADIIANRHTNKFILNNCNNVSSITRNDNHIKFKNIYISSNSANNALVYIAKFVTIESSELYDTAGSLLTINDSFLTISNNTKINGETVIILNQKAECSLSDITPDSNFKISNNAGGVNVLSTLRLNNVNCTKLTISQHLGYLKSDYSTFILETKSVTDKSLIDIHNSVVYMPMPRLAEARISAANSEIYFTGNDEETVSTATNISLINCYVSSESPLKVKSQWDNCHINMSAVDTETKPIIEIESVQVEPKIFNYIQNGNIYLKLTDKTERRPEAIKINPTNLGYIANTTITATKTQPAQTFTKIINLPEYMSNCTIQDDITTQDVSIKGSQKIKMNNATP